MSYSFPTLQKFLGGFFHQDWCDYYSDPETVILAIRQGASHAELAAMKKELRQILALNLTEVLMRAMFVRDIGCYIEPTAFGLTYVQFVSGLIDVLTHAAGPETEQRQDGENREH